MTTLRTSATLACMLATTELAAAQTTARVPGCDGDRDGTVSGDGRFVAFGNGYNGVHLSDLSAGTTVLVSRAPDGTPGNGISRNASVSSDGSFVAFESGSDNLVPGVVNHVYNVYVFDVANQTTTLVSVDSNGVQANGSSSSPSISADGRYVAFTSSATNLVANDTNGRSDVFVRDLVAGTTEIVSVDASGVFGDGDSSWPSISSDGRYVAFQSNSSNLAAGTAPGAENVYVHDRQTGATVLASVASDGTPGNANSSWPSLSSDGRYLAFDSDCTNLVPNDVNGHRDVFVHDLVSGVTTIVSVDSSGVQGDGDSAEGLAISGDGTRVVFQSDATNLVQGDANGARDVFVRDLLRGTTKRLSVDSSGVEGDADSGFNDSMRCVSDDGSVVAFNSVATNLDPADQNNSIDVFTSIDCDVRASWSNYGSGLAGTDGVPNMTPEGEPVLGTTLTVDVDNSSNKYTIGLVFVGYQQTDLPTAWIGHLLVLPSFTVVLPFSPWGPSSIDGDLPDDDTLCGLEVDVQAIELDSGAPKGVSFTPGLQLILGR